MLSRALIVQQQHVSVRLYRTMPPNAVYPWTKGVKLRIIALWYWRSCQCFLRGLKLIRTKSLTSSKHHHSINDPAIMTLLFPQNTHTEDQQSLKASVPPISSTKYDRSQTHWKRSLKIDVQWRTPSEESAQTRRFYNQKSERSLDSKDTLAAFAICSTAKNMRATNNGRIRSRLPNSSLPSTQLFILLEEKQRETRPIRNKIDLR